MSNSMTLYILIKHDNSLYIAHCLELDIVATSDSIDGVKADIVSLIKAQIEYAFLNDNLDHLFSPAPSEVWEEFYNCEEAHEERYDIEPSREGKSRKEFVPPRLIARMCLSEQSQCYA